MTIVIAGDRSGVGKTTVTLAMLAALRQRHWRSQSASVVQSFKVGPDYIDPMFHQAITGLPCRNLDPILTSESYIQFCFAHHAQRADYALIEGVMGLFDGASGSLDIASTAHIARLLNLPIVLVLDCSRLSGSIAAIVHGYCSFDPRLQFAGVVLNRVGSDRHLELLNEALQPLNLPILGVLRRQEAIQIPDRHLGLVPTAELPELRPLINRLAHLGETCFDWEKLLPLLVAGSAADVNHSDRAADYSGVFNPTEAKPRIAIAQDAAFSFYYADNLESLARSGAELVFWSPLQDRTLPQGVSGLYLGGGFPEMFAESLADNRSALTAVRSAIRSGMPTYAECGGLMYLCNQLVDFDRQSWQMVGVLPATVRMGDRLTLGYRKATALQNSPMLVDGTTIWGHEFHRSQLDLAPARSLYQVRGYRPDSPIGFEGWQMHQLHASYIHLHWGAQPEIADRFVQHCTDYATQRAAQG